MNSAITGIHHITAIAGDTQANIDFYAGLLGLRLVKKTVNFDDPTAYHLYYGDATGAPGTIVTFFTWPEGSAHGRAGTGQVARISLSIHPGSLDYWVERLNRHGVAASRGQRFGEEVISFGDGTGIAVELVGVADDTRSGWTGGSIPARHAIRGLHTAELSVAASGPTEALIAGEMGYRLVRRDGARARFETGTGGSGTYIDVVEHPGGLPGRGGVGTIHHIAWRVPDDAAEASFQKTLSAGGYPVSPVRDRNYFRSIYYRERGGILFEIATDVPGFPVDEPAASLGTQLKLPAQFEHARAEIEHHLPAIRPARVFA